VRMVDLRTGATTVLAGDSSSIYVEMNASLGPAGWHVSRDGNSVIWYSARDGWGHLYRYDRSGRATQLTSGQWAVGDVVAADDATQRVFFIGYGREPGTRDPLYGKLYSVRFDGTALTLLTPEDAEHRISISPDRKYIVDNYSRVDLPSATVLRAIDD